MATKKHIVTLVKNDIQKLLDRKTLLITSTEGQIEITLAEGLTYDQIFDCLMAIQG